MRTAVLVTFDLVRPGEPSVSLAAGSLLASLRRHAGFRESGMELHHMGVNLLDIGLDAAPAAVVSALDRLNIGEQDAVALSCHVWSEVVVRDVLARLRRSGFKGKIIMGGPQVSYAPREALGALYPEANVFVLGYGESALAEAFLTRPGSGLAFAEAPVDFANLPSPYLGNDLPVADGQAMVRLETRRGCGFRCSFCAHRDLRRNAIHRIDARRAELEFEFFQAKGVKKVNVVDPVFNEGPDYLDLLRVLVERRFSAQLSLQTRLELIRDERGREFLDLAASLNTTLEFGLQTALEEESVAINRKNKLAAIGSALRMVSERGIDFEVSLIYGLPGQSVQSFQSSIDFLRDSGCDRIVAFPLMLLRGTELEAQRDRWAFREAPSGKFAIPVVCQSSSFTEAEWWQMKEIADRLGPTGRI